jgi:uncharacterized membrane protein
MRKIWDGDTTNKVMSDANGYRKASEQVSDGWWVRLPG